MPARVWMAEIIFTMPNSAWRCSPKESLQRRRSGKKPGRLASILERGVRLALAIPVAGLRMFHGARFLLRPGDVCHPFPWGAAHELGKRQEPQGAALRRGSDAVHLLPPI